MALNMFHKFHELMYAYRKEKFEIHTDTHTNAFAFALIHSAGHMLSVCVAIIYL